ncbi:hypothetical protein CVT24_013293 [Panaeolus cyanescens]|uniref:Uncharacterized protein n=1 Tax=Panaeolus cyanescens TaxID=181874 RepID=A0A409YMF8_9AGAR|nr:hypothetical protein CVT24_013293 [Panaeolus cyanescens]
MSQRKTISSAAQRRETYLDTEMDMEPWTVTAAFQVRKSIQPIGAASIIEHIRTVYTSRLPPVPGNETDTMFYTSFVSCL